MATAHPLIDHEEIRRWAESRDARPTSVLGTGNGQSPMIQLDFPGYSGEESLQEITWEEWFEAFDEGGLALLVQEANADGEPSNFNKLIRRDTDG